MKPVVRGQAGTALIECAAVATVLATIVGVTLSAVYVHFVRAYFEYATEQTLFCLAEGQPPSRCRADLLRQIRSRPFVTNGEVRAQTTRTRWEVAVKWRITRLNFSLAKSLTARQILRGGALR